MLISVNYYRINDLKGTALINPELIGYCKEGIYGQTPIKVLNINDSIFPIPLEEWERIKSYIHIIEKGSEYMDD